VTEGRDSDNPIVLLCSIAIRASVWKRGDSPQPRAYRYEFRATIGGTTVAETKSADNGCVKRRWLVQKTYGGRIYSGRTTVEITGGKIMLWTILVVLMILWLLGLIGGVGGGLIHLLLVVAVIVLLFQLLSGRRSVV